MQEREEIKQLFERYRAGRCTPEEQARLHAWFNRYTGHEASGLDELKVAFESGQTAKRSRGFRWFPYAAAAVLALAAGLYFFQPNVENGISGIDNLTAADILPGSNRATLTLADGRTVDLSEAQAGIIIGDGITYLDGSAVLSPEVGKSESPEDSPHVGLATYDLRLTTPKGGTYQIMLSDGTQVWLNAASTLKYPSRFESNERVVEIDGEGYFAVTKDRSRPFKVVSKGQEVEVLGTEFNISAYADDNTVKTTLVEGAVQIVNRQSKIVNKLLPGEQSVVRGATTDIRQVATEPYIAWKNGDFYFDNTPLADMMKQIGRWYDVEVVYEKAVPKEKFSGAMSRNVTLQTVLELLRISEINYRIEKNKLIIE